MDLIKTLDRLTDTTKELLDICREQAEVIEQNDLISVEMAMDRRGELESFKKALEGVNKIGL